MSFVETFRIPQDALGKLNFEYLRLLQPETQEKITLFGKIHNVPRYQQAYGKDYKFSNTISKALEVPVYFDPLFKFFNEKYKCKFNMMLINWYPNGNYYINMHSDDEKQIIPNTPIVTISFGATRKFITLEKHNGTKTIYKLNDQDVLVMCGTFQKTHKHGIPKETNVDSMRISITLRCFYQFC